jgi:hypothetical protein
MREKGGSATLGELVGKQSDMSLAKISDVLGEKTPDLPRNNVGRFRLTQALKQRFGEGFRNIPGVRNIIKDFDEEMRFDHLLGKMKKIKGVPSGKSS